MNPQHVVSLNQRRIERKDGIAGVTEPSSLHLRQLDGRDFRQVEVFLRTDPVGFVYPLGWLLRDGIVPQSRHQHFLFTGAFSLRELVGLTLKAGNVLLFVATHDPAAACALMDAESVVPGAFRVVLGPREPVDAAWRRLSERSFHARLHRPQKVYVTLPSTLTRYPAPELRLAQLEDMKPLLEATVDMHEHESLERLRPADVSAFRRGLQYQINSRRVFVWLEPTDRSVRFKASISADCDCGAQIEGVYVAPEHRRQGYASKALSELCQRLFRTTPIVSLYVNNDNLPAINLYESQLGFDMALDFKTIFMVR